MIPIKKRFSLLLLLGLSVLALLLLMQSIGNVYGGLTYVAWLWLVLLFLPPLGFLLKGPESLKKSSATPLTILVVLFVIIALLGILLQPIAITYWADGTLGGHVIRIRALLYTLFLLIPLEVLIIYLFRKSFQKGVDFTPPKVPTAFISYNHNDLKTAKRIQNRLEKARIKVIIDHNNMQAGEDIQNFIETSIMESTATISLVSNASLSSGWVAMETMDTFFIGRYLKHRKFIACYLDNDFFEDGYVVQTGAKIKKLIEEKLKHKAEQHQLGMDSRNLNDEISRLKQLKGNLDGIIAKLKNELCLDVSDQNFEQSMTRLIKDIKSED